MAGGDDASPRGTAAEEAEASARISPTGEYTGQVWIAHGLADPRFGTRRGHLLYRALQPVNAAYERLAGRPGVETMLVARHRVLDHLLERHVAAGATHVIEIAAGLSARGARFVARHPDLVYVEGDLPRVAAAKRRALTAAGLRHRGHHVVTLDALRGRGRHSLAAVARAHLTPRARTVVLTEGLLPYLPADAVAELWHRVAATLRERGGGVYLSDLHLRDDATGMRTVELFRGLIALFTRGPVEFHFADPAAVAAALRAAGFAAVAVHRLEDLSAEVDVPGRELGHVIRVFEAWLEAATGRTGPR